MMFSLARGNIEAIILETPTVNVHVAPANLALVGAEIELIHAPRREFRLADVF